MRTGGGTFTFQEKAGSVSRDFSSSPPPAPASQGLRAHGLTRACTAPGPGPPRHCPSCRRSWGTRPSHRRWHQVLFGAAKEKRCVSGCTTPPPPELPALHKPPALLSQLADTLASTGWHEKRWRGGEGSEGVAAVVGVVTREAAPGDWSCKGDVVPAEAEVTCCARNKSYKIWGPALCSRC